MDTFSLLTTVKINKTIYFDSKIEAIITFIVTISAAIISGYMLCHTIYKFYIEDISDLLQDDDLTPKVQRKSRSKLPRISSNDQRHLSHHKEIHEIIAFFTILYLFSGVIYTFTQSIIRIMIIFFNSTISCQANEYLQFMVAVIRSMLYLLFLSRLYLTFLGSHLAYNTFKLIILGIIILLTNISSTIYWIINTKQQINKNNGKCIINYTIPASIIIIVDTSINIILLYAFIHKLSQLIQIQTAGYIDMNGNGDPMALKRIKDLIKLMTKLTVLACIAVISSWITTAIFIGFLPHIVTQFNIVIGTFCILFCYEFHKSKYMNYCFLCRQLCYHGCFWWFISQDYICKKNDKNDREKDQFQGGCFAVLCVCYKYDNNDNNQILINQTQELVVNNNGIPTKDGGKSFTDEILKRSPTDEQLNFTFSHRAYTLKKIHNLLADDEGIENNLKQLKFTLTRSKKLHTLNSIKIMEQNKSTEIVYCD